MLIKLSYALLSFSSFCFINKTNAQIPIYRAYQINEKNIFRVSTADKLDIQLLMTKKDLRKELHSYFKVYIPNISTFNSVEIIDVNSSYYIILSSKENRLICMVYPTTRLNTDYTFYILGTNHILTLKSSDLCYPKINSKACSKNHANNPEHQLINTKL